MYEMSSKLYPLGYSPANGQGYSPALHKAPIIEPLEDQSYAPRQEHGEFALGLNQTVSPAQGYIFEMPDQLVTAESYSDLPSFEQANDLVSPLKRKHAAATAEDKSPIKRQRRKRRANRTSEARKTDRTDSERALRRARIVEIHGSVGAKDKPKGRIQIRNGGIEWYDEELEIWRPAAMLDSFRRHFIDEDSTRGMYDEPPDRGQHADDRTSFCSALGQNHWNFVAKRAWHNILDHEGNKVLYLIEKPERKNEPPEPGRLWIHDGLVMLDPDDCPIRDFPDVPRCFSSKMEGARIEALRRIYGMNIPDIRARMPRTIETKSGTEPLFGLTSINQRLCRFRERNECPAWIARAGNPALRNFTMAKLSDEARQSKTTEGLEPIVKREIERRKRVNKGRLTEKAGGRHIHTSESHSRNEASMQPLQRQETTHSTLDEYPSQSIVFNTDQVANDPYSIIQDDRANLLQFYDHIYGQHQSLQNADETIFNENLAPPCQEQDNFFTFDFGESELGRLKEQSGMETPSLKEHPARQDLTQDSFHFGLLNDDFAEDSFATENLSMAEETNPKPAHDNRPREEEEPKTVEANSKLSQYSPATAGPDKTEIIDFRALPPRTLREQLVIKALLSCTIADYRFWNHCDPPLTPNDWSLQAQYQRIQSHHDITWPLPCEPSQLVVTRPFASFDCIPTPDLPDEELSRLLPSSDVGYAEHAIGVTDVNLEGLVFQESGSLPEDAFEQFLNDEDCKNKSPST